MPYENVLHTTAYPLLSRIPAPVLEMLFFLEEMGLGEKGVQYKMKDWAFNRQRYWGEPEPLVYCEHCGGWVPEPEDPLPVPLPEEERKDPASRARALNTADIAILCLPDAAAAQLACDTVFNGKAL